MASETIPSGRLERHRRLLLIGGPALILIAAAVLYLTGGRYVSTDDAYVQAARVEISANIPGRVIEVEVKDNQRVRRGDPLFRLDDRRFRIAVEGAQARLAAARMRIAALKATYRQRQADVLAAEDTLAYLDTELARQRKLASQGISSQAQLDQARHAEADARQKLSAAEQAQANVKAGLDGDPGIGIDRHPEVQEAKAALDQAELELSYTRVRAPMDGIVSKVEQLQPGEYINAAAPVFSLTSDQDVWVEANFRETDLTHMRPGQPATVEIDAYPGHTLHGRLESLSSGTGSSFSLLPPENATGNWVKVVQRLPVRIRLDKVDPALPLHAGLSAVVDVDTGHSRLKDLL